jgi:radical SAM protein with 4Fe4S-binding SPASM domain
MGGLACNVKSNYCGTGSRGTYFISHLGDVYPCPNMRFNPFQLGNIKEKSFREVTGSNPTVKKLKLLSVDKMNDKCPSCDVKYFCGGFCRGETYANTGDINSPYVRCEEYREGILEAMWELSANPDLYESKANEFFENASIINGNSSNSK